jgi:HK97 family phage portal protein
MAFTLFKKSSSSMPATKASAAGITQSSTPGSMVSLQPLGRARWTSRRYESQIEEGYRKNVIAWRCVTMIAEAMANIPLLLYGARGKIIDGKHPLLQLLRRPNPLMSGADFLSACATTWQLAGNVYVEGVRPEADLPPTELYLLRPDRMKVVPGPNGLPLGYEYAVQGKAHRWPADPLTGACNILHWRAFNPLDDWYGIAPLEAAMMSVDQHNAAGTWNQALLQQSARPSGALVYAPKEGPQTLTNDQLQRLREEFDTSYGGARNAGRPLILEGGLEWKPLSLSPHDMEWLAGRDIAARDIALAFGVPAQLVGISGSQTYNNMVEARFALYEETIIPLAQRLISALNAWLVPMFDVNGTRSLRLDIDTDEISALSPRRERTWAKVSNADFLSINEKRAALGYPPVAGGDVVSVIAPDTIPSTSDGNA